MNIIALEQSINTLEREVNTLNGKVTLLGDQHRESIQKVQDLRTLDLTNQKAIELLNFVQKTTKEVIANIFENIVTKALQFIHQNNDYRFNLEFGQRGNLPELRFNVKTPDMQEPHDILDTRGGGSADIISLALRFVLLEVSKTPGFLFVDEPFKHLDNSETLKKALEFVQETQKNTNRQVFIITHKQEIVEGVSNPIILGNSVQRSTTKALNVKIEEPKKKRGRPKNV